jgi:hypothetical protein
MDRSRGPRPRVRWFGSARAAPGTMCGTLSTALAVLAVGAACSGLVLVRLATRPTARPNCARLWAVCVCGGGTPGGVCVVCVCAGSCVDGVRWTPCVGHLMCGRVCVLATNQHGRVVWVGGFWCCARVLLTYSLLGPIWAPYGPPMDPLWTSFVHRILVQQVTPCL